MFLLLGTAFLATTAFAATPCLNPSLACSEKLAIGAKGQHVLIYRNHSPLKGDNSVEHALVMVHGAQRNGDGYFATALAAAASRGQLLNTVVIAPSFKGDNGRACKDEHEPGELFWDCQGWNAGYTATNSDKAKPASSYDAMDRIVALLNDRARFPKLKTIVLAGHSGGGQFMNRYAAANRAGQKSALPIRYVAANPSSFVYLNDLRPPAGGGCTANGKCPGPFEMYSEAAACPGYNTYRYGLDGLEGYAAITGADAIRAEYPKRDMTYLYGDLDNLQDSDLDKTCGAQAQGPNRRERSLAYWNYITSQFGATHKLVVVPRCGHNAACMFTASAGAKVLFP